MLSAGPNNRRRSHPPLEKGKFRKTGRDLYGEMLLDLINDPELHPTQQMNKIIQMLDQGANFNLEVYEDDEGSTPLMEAAAAGNLELINLFIAKIFKAFNPTLATNNFINATDNDGTTALKEAQRAGFREIVMVLKKSGAK